MAKVTIALSERAIFLKPPFPSSAGVPPPALQAGCHSHLPMPLPAKPAGRSVGRSVKRSGKSVCRSVKRSGKSVGLASRRASRRASCMVGRSVGRPPPSFLPAAAAAGAQASGCRRWCSGSRMLASYVYAAITCTVV